MKFSSEGKEFLFGLLALVERWKKPLAAPVLSEDERITAELLLEAQDLINEQANKLSGWALDFPETRLWVEKVHRFNARMAPWLEQYFGIKEGEDT